MMPCEMIHIHLASYCIRTVLCATTVFRYHLTLCQFQLVDTLRFLYTIKTKKKFAC